VLAKSSGTDYDTAWTTRVGQLIGFTAYQRPTDGAFITTSSTTFVDVDATNLRVTFTAPPSGNVLARVTAMIEPSTTTTVVYINFRDTVTGDVSGTQVYCCNTPAVDNSTHTVAVTGLTPGTSYTWKLGAKKGGTGNAIVEGGPTYGTIILEVLSA
jgi:hypothetical protein